MLFKKQVDQHNVYFIFYEIKLTENTGKKQSVGLFYKMNKAVLLHTASHYYCFVTISSLMVPPFYWLTQKDSKLLYIKNHI